MKRILLDTHVFIWSTSNKTAHNIGKNARQMMMNNEAYLSSLSVAEISIKIMTGRLKFSEVTKQDLLDMNIQELEFSVLPAEHISNLESLVGHDPFDRMLLP